MRNIRTTLALLAVLASGKAPGQAVPLSRAVFDSTPKAFRALDLSKAANRGFRDEAAGDGKGGWTDQGPNDMRGFTARGRTLFCGIPFDILDPDANGGLSCIVLRGQNREDFPVRVEWPVRGRAAGLHVLHTAAWSADTVAVYRVRYTDGTEEGVPVRDGAEVFNWWGEAESDAARLAWTGPNGATDAVSLFLFTWANPFPDRDIVSVAAETSGSGAFLMLLAVTAADKGPFLPESADGRSETDRTGWFALPTCDVTPAPGTAPDLSGLNEKPAGRHGFLRAAGDGFAFEDGTPVRFWGTNVVAGSAFPDRATADRVSRSLAAFGFNLVRFHHMDAEWAKPNLFGPEGGPSSDSDEVLSDESLDRLDYFVSRLKEEGVYVFLDLLVHRGFSAAELGGREDPGLGAKGAGIFDPHLTALQKRFAEKLLTHRNPYTGKRYVDEPAVVLSEVINESSLFYLGGLADLEAKTPGYASDLRRRFEDWCAGRQVGAPRGALSSLAEGGDPLVLEFLFETQTAAFLGMRGFLRGLGYRVPVAGTNHWEKWTGDLRSNAALDWIDTHAYWDHPQGGFEPTGTTFHNRPMVRRLAKGILSNLGAMQVEGKPLTVSEWNFVWPNEHIAEGPLLTAAYAALQGWDGPVQFAHAHGWGADRMQGCFNNWNKPHFMAANVAAALLFRRGDVDRAETGWRVRLPRDPALFHRDPLEGMPEGLDLVFRIASAADTGLPEIRRALPGEAAAGRFLSATGQLSAEPDSGRFVLDTPRSQGILGFFPGRTACTRDLAVTPATVFCQVVATSLDPAAGLSAARRVLLTALARAENTGQVYGPRRRSLLEEGRAPVLMEPVRASVRLRSDRPLSVHPLDASGRRTGRTLEASRSREGWATFEIGNEGVFWYELERR
jgi:hypothetical protein